MSENESVIGCVDDLPFLGSLHGFCFFASGRLPSAYGYVCHHWTYLVHGFGCGGPESENDDASEIFDAHRLRGHVHGFGCGGVSSLCDGVGIDLQFASHFVDDT